MASDSFVGEGLRPSPYEEERAKNTHAGLRAAYQKAEVMLSALRLKNELLAGENARLRGLLLEASKHCPDDFNGDDAYLLNRIENALGMCPNCVTPWKCNGPHIPKHIQPEEAEPVVCNPADYCACQHQPLYLHPPAKQTPMTDEEVLAKCAVSENSAHRLMCLAVARAVERHHGIQGGK